MPVDINDDKSLYGKAARRFVQLRARGLFFRCNGFTLVELVVVCAILGVLVTVAIPAFSNVLQSTKKSRAAADIRAIEKAIVAYSADKGVLPDSLSDVGMSEQYDPWLRKYEYQNLGSVGATPLEDIAGVQLNHDFDIYSKGEDGLSSATSGDPSNSDDITRSNDGVYAGLRP